MTPGLFISTGGPTHALGRRFGLGKANGDCALLGLAIGLSLWFVLVSLALLEGRAAQIFSFAALSEHARLLLVIPLLFFADAWVGPRQIEFTSELLQTGIIPKESSPRLERIAACLSRLRDSYAIALFLLALAAMTSALKIEPLEIPVFAIKLDDGNETAWSSAWYGYVCLTVFRFLLVTWLWRILLWCYYLWTLSRLPLRLNPAHPDGVAGLGFLEVVHLQFLPIVVGFSALQSAIFAEELAIGTVSLQTILLTTALVLLADAILFIAPLAFFLSRLWRARLNGLLAYSALSDDYVSHFAKKWIEGKPSAGEQLLGSSDIQSLADLTNSFRVVQSMRIWPASKRLFLTLGVAALAPLLPLILFKYPLLDLAEDFLRSLTGL